MRNTILQIALAALLAFVAACADDATSDQKTEEKTEKAVPVEIHVIATGEVVDRVTATGTVVAKHDVLVSSETAGTVKTVFVGVGDQVQKDQILVQVDAELKELAVQQAQASVQQTKATLEKAERDFERNRTLFDSQDISEHVFETARLQKESAQAAFVTADANMKMAQRQLRDTGIRSPVNGYVAARQVDIGSTVTPGLPVARVVDISQVKVTFGAPERDVMKLRRGQSASITLTSLQNLQFDGKVTAIGPQADLSSRTFPVEVLVDNPGGRIKAGMTAGVTVATETLSEAPLLPQRALVERAGKTIVFVVENGKARKRQPKLGIQSGESLAVLSEVAAGDSVVVLGQENLSDGVVVLVRSRE